MHDIRNAGMNMYIRQLTTPCMQVESHSSRMRSFTAFAANFFRSDSGRSAPISIKVQVSSSPQDKLS